MLLSLLLFLAVQQPQSQAVMWQFHPGQEFFVEETHRQLYQAKRPIEVTTYLDYSLLLRYRMVGRQNRSVVLECHTERVRVNNPVEAGQPAIELLKKREGQITRKTLRRTADGWVQESPSTTDSTFGTLLFCLGTTQYSADKPSWQQHWDWAAPQIGNLRLELTCLVKSPPTEGLWRTEIRPAWEWTGTAAGSSKKWRNVPMTSAGIGIFNKQRNRWDHVDFRVAGILESHSPPTEIKSDFSVIYRVSDSRPNWPDK